MAKISTIPNAFELMDGLTVLIAEDEATNIRYLQILLKPLNARILFANNGKEAIEICKQNPDIKLILMDIKMPVMDGHTAAKLIKEMRPDLPIIAQTAYALKSEVEKFEGVFNDYITKPIKADLLMHKINEQLK